MPELKDGEFYCDNYVVVMNKKDCLSCKGRKLCELDCKVRNF